MSIFSSFQKDSSPEYSGEWYVPDAEPADYASDRVREKGYSMIAAILHVVIGLIPAMGLSAVYAAAFYSVGLFIVLYMTWLIYRGPSEKRPLSRPDYSKYVQRTKILATAARVVVLLTFAGDLIGNFALRLDISVWMVLQIILLLLEALDLQFLYRHQRDMTYSVEVK